MLFFGKKKKIKKPELNVAVETMPSDFLGGANPVVQFKNVSKTITSPANKNTVLTAGEKRIFDKKTAVGAGKEKHISNLLSSRKFIFISMAGLFLLFSLGASVYYLLPYFNAPEQVAVVPEQSATEDIAPKQVAEVPTEIEDTNLLVDTTESTTEPVIEDTIVLPGATMNLPSMLLGDSVDYDNDDITDMAEDLFMTDLGVHDSDNDKYPDGHEVYYLYNPVGVEPMKLIDSGLVVEYENPVFGYKLYYPKSWAVGNVDANYRDVLFSTLTGENIEVRVFDLSENQTLSGWIGDNVPDERISDLIDFTTSFKDEGYRRSDYLVYYFINHQRLYVIAYHTTDSNVVNYRIVAKMMARSFRFGNVKEGDQTVLPVENEMTAGLKEYVVTSSTEDNLNNSTTTVNSDNNSSNDINSEVGDPII